MMVYYIYFVCCNWSAIDETRCMDQRVFYAVNNKLRLFPFSGSVGGGSGGEGGAQANTNSLVRKSYVQLS